MEQTVTCASCGLPMEVARTEPVMRALGAGTEDRLPTDQPSPTRIYKVYVCANHHEMKRMEKRLPHDPGSDG